MRLLYELKQFQSVRERWLKSVKALTLLSTLQSADIILPTTDGREIRLRSITEPAAEQNSVPTHFCTRPGMCWYSRDPSAGPNRRPKRIRDSPLV
jgi:hypothetical protein